MRTLFALTLVTLLAGCTAPETTPTPTAPDTRAPLMQLQLDGAALQGTFDVADVAGACAQWDTLRLEGDLVIAGSDLARLPDVSCLTVVSGDLVIADNPDLTSLEPLHGLRSLGGDLVVTDNPELLDLLGLDRLRTARSVTIARNPALLDLEGLDALVDVQEHLTIADNDGIQSLEGLLALSTTWSGDITVQGNSDLRDLTGLDTLTTVLGTIEVSKNPRLTSVTGLDSLVTLGDSLRLHANDALEDITALLSLDTIGGDLLVTDNPRLARENVDALLDSIADIEGSVILDGNHD